MSRRLLASAGVGAKRAALPALWMSEVFAILLFALSLYAVFLPGNPEWGPWAAGLLALLGVAVAVSIAVAAWVLLRGLIPGNAARAGIAFAGFVGFGVLATMTWSGSAGSTSDTSGTSGTLRAPLGNALPAPLDAAWGAAFALLVFYGVAWLALTGLYWPTRARDQRSYRRRLAPRSRPTRPDAPTDAPSKEVDADA